MKQRHSWEITDDFWAGAEPLLPLRGWDPAKLYQRQPPSGSPHRTGRNILRVPHRHPLECPTPRFGFPSPVYRRFRRWCNAGFFESLWRAGLAAYDEAKGIAWT
jgi:transposase